MVQSARVQKVLVGDDVLLSHQIMEDIAYNAELSRAPVELATGDLVSFFYPLADATSQDLIGYPGDPAGALPDSEFLVAIPGVVPAVNVGDVVRGTSTFQIGLGRTVRAEISRLKATTTGDTTVDSAAVTGVASVVGIAVGMLVVGAGIPARTIVTAVGTTSVGLSQLATATASAATLKFYKKESHYLYDEVDVVDRAFPLPPESLNLT